MTTIPQRVPFLWRGRPVRAILLDMDGTIADTKEVHADAWVVWANRHGIEISREKYLSDYFGRSNNDVMPELLPQYAHDVERLRELGMEKEHEFLAMVLKGHLPPTPGLHDFVERCAARGLGLAIASSAPRENVETVSREFGLTEFVPVRLSMDDVPKAKPAPDLFLEAAARLGIPPAECVVVEDSRHGLAGGRAAGCRTVGITTLHDADEIADLADVSVRDFSELLSREEWRTL